MSEKHTKTISVEGTEITILQIDDTDYICITDMLKAKDGDFVVKDWLRNRNTLEFLGIWEKVYNPDFNWGEFALIRNQAGLNRFRISVKEYTAVRGDPPVSAGEYFQDGRPSCLKPWRGRAYRCAAPCSGYTTGQNRV